MQTELLQNTKLAFIGCGVMAESIIAGLLRQNLVGSEQICASHPRSNRREELAEKYKIGVFQHNADAVKTLPKRIQRFFSASNRNASAAF